MTLTVGDGYPGLEVPHHWYSGDGLTLLATLNDLSIVPHCKINKISGLHNLADADDNRADHVGRRGQSIYPGYDRSKTVTYEGVMRGKSLNDPNFMRGLLRYAFQDRTHEGIMFMGTDWYYKARVQSIESDDEQTTGLTFRYPFQRDFTLGLIMSDPRIYWHEPIAFTARTNTYEQEFTNPGLCDSDPIIAIHNTVAGAITVENYAVPGTTGGHAALRLDEVPASTLVTIDFYHRIILADGVDIGSHIKSTTDWFDEGKPGVVPGSNTIKVSAGSGSTWDFGVNPAVP